MNDLFGILSVTLPTLKHQEVIILLKQTIAHYWQKIQGTLFPLLEEELPPLTQKQQQLVSILEVLRIEEFVVPTCPGFRGRPEKSRGAILRAFVAKSVYNMPTTRMLIERLHSDMPFRRICGFEFRSEIPSESVFSRAFTEFATTGLLTQVHAELIKTHYKNEIVGHVITDSSAIEAQEKPAKKIKEVVVNKPKNPGGRPRKGQEKPKEMTRIETQASGLMTLEEMLKDLPQLRFLTIQDLLKKLKILTQNIPSPFQVDIKGL